MAAEVCALGARKSPLRRRCRAPDTVCLALAMAIALLLPRSSQAQTPAPSLGSMASAGSAVSTASTANSGGTVGLGSDLLQPSLGGNPATPPRFRRPGAATPLAADQPPPDRFVAPTRIGATPIYGSPNGLGAGNTGYDSLNTPRSKKKEKVAARTRAGRTRSAGSGNHFHAGADVQSRRAKYAPGAGQSAATLDLSEDCGDPARRKFAAIAD